jgi:hypothetical protein
MAHCCPAWLVGDDAPDLPALLHAGLDLTPESTRSTPTAPDSGGGLFIALKSVYFLF